MCRASIASRGRNAAVGRRECRVDNEMSSVAGDQKTRPPVKSVVAFSFFSSYRSIIPEYTRCSRNHHFGPDYVSRIIVQLRNGSEQGVHTYRVGQKSDTSRTLHYIVRDVSLFWPTLYVPLSSSCIIWYRSMGGDALRLGR